VAVYKVRVQGDDCPTMFNNIKNTLSHLHNKWNRKYKDYGSGFYLYTGTRLSGPIYVENAFINLTSGLEELHRRKHADRPIDKKLTAKIERILAQIEREADRRWALRFLNRAYDPSLNVRLNSLIASIGINFNMAGVQQFTERCRIIRNNIAHGASPELIQEAAEKNVVLGYLYHALILREIGLSAEMVEGWLRGPSSIREWLVRAGLFKQDGSTG